MPSQKADPGASVLVFNLGNNPIQHGTIGVIRTLGRMGVDVYAAVSDHLAPAASSRYVTGSFVWRTAGAEPEHLAARLLAFGEQIGRRTILVPTDDQAAAFVAEQADTLEERFIFPHPPQCLPRRLANKRELYELCESTGIPYPKSVFPLSVEDVRVFVQQAQFPVVVKAAELQRVRNGSPSTSIVRSASELIRMYRQAEDLDGPSLIFQEYIRPDSGEDWVYHGYWNPETGCRLAFTGKKLRSHPTSAGPTTLGVPVMNETLCRQTERLLEAIGYAGIMDLDYRFDKRDGQFKLLDFNPRIGANFRMFENGEGIDVVRALYLDLTGHSVPQSPVMKQRTFVVESHDLMASIGYMRDRRLTVGDWWKSLKGEKELAWFSKDDPLPALLACSRLLARVMTRELPKKPVRTRRIEPRQVPADAPVAGWDPGVGGD
jgi:predicted ATP-grasp superfamily ATP-dependent carboligase